MTAEKLLTYALGRGVEYQDMPLVRSIARDAARQENRFSALVLAVVRSKPFQMNMKMPDAAVPTSGGGIRGDGGNGITLRNGAAETNREDMVFSVLPPLLRFSVCLPFAPSSPLPE